MIDEALDHLDSLRLVDDALKLVRELPYGRQRLVEIAIALAQKPRVLLLDEPAAGVPSSESHLILDVVAALDPDIAILIIEHDMDVVFRFAKEITVLVQGAVFTQGTPEEIMANAARARGLSRRGRPHAEAAMAERGARARAGSSPATARPWCWRISRSRSAPARRCRSSAATASARSTLLATVMGHTTLHGGAHPPARQGHRRTVATYRRVDRAGSAWCRRSARFFPR